MYEQLTNGKHFVYRIGDGGSGLVHAENYDDAIGKVLAAYSKHGQPELSKDDISVYDIVSYFKDSPCVIELLEGDFTP